MTPTKIYEWPAVKTPSAIFEYCTAANHMKKSTRVVLLQKNRFRQKCSQKRLCPTPHI